MEAYIKQFKGKPPTWTQFYNKIYVYTLFIINKIILKMS